MRYVATSATIMLGLATVLLPMQPVCAAEILGNASIRGAIDCSLTGAKFPASVGQPMVVTYTGSMDLVADGLGKFVSGHMATRGTGDMQAVRGSRSCEFNLTSGTYSVGPDGTGHSVTSWAYWEGGGSTMSDQLCSDNVFHPQHFQGLDLNNMRKERNRVVETFLLPAAPDGMVHWVGMDETGLTVAVCKQQRPQQ
jgi:hypothetical protein